MEASQNSTNYWDTYCKEAKEVAECQHTNTDSITVSDYDWALEREFFVTRTVCLDCNKRIY